MSDSEAPDGHIKHGHICDPVWSPDGLAQGIEEQINTVLTRVSVLIKCADCCFIVGYWEGVDNLRLTPIIYIFLQFSPNFILF